MLSIHPFMQQHENQLVKFWKNALLTLCRTPSFKPDFLRKAAASEAPI